MKNDTKTYAEIQNIVENARNITKENTKKVFRVLGAGIIIILGFVIWNIISGKIDDNRNNTYTSVTNSAEKLIESKKYDEAEKLLDEVDNKHKIEIKSKIQLSKLTEKLEDLEPLLNRKEYSKLKMELEKLRWTKISPNSDWDLERIERDVFKNFIEKKKAINNQMPEDKRAEIESEYSL